MKTLPAAKPYCNTAPHNLPPSKRVQSTGDQLTDEILGILIGFAKVLEKRNGWVDCITCQQAEAEIRQLIESECSKVDAHGELLRRIPKTT